VGTKFLWWKGEPKVGKRRFKVLKFTAMRKVVPLVLATALAWAACEPLPDTVPLPTKICVRTSHHGQPIPQATVFIKYHVDSFPGYDQPASFFDATFKTGADARGCFAPVPEGRHWIIAFGYDSLHYPHHVYGSLKTEISLHHRPVLDTILYVSE
jgi:hypothetical protein